MKTVYADGRPARDAVEGKKDLPLFRVDERAKVIALHEGKGKGEDVGGRYAEKGDGETFGETLAEGEGDPHAREGAGTERHEAAPKGRPRRTRGPRAVAETLTGSTSEGWRSTLRVALLYETASSVPRARLRKSMELSRPRRSLSDMKEPHDIVERGEHHDAHEDAEAHLLRDIDGLRRDFPAHDDLYDREEVCGRRRGSVWGAG